MFKMLENIEFKYYINIQQLLLAFIKQSEASDVSNAILNIEQTQNSKRTIESISKQIESNNVDNWVERFESGKLPSNIINNYIILYRLLQKELFLLTEFNNTIQLLEKEQ